MVFTVSSCKKDFYTEANVNPNSPPTVTPSALLSSAEGSIAYTQGGTFGLFIALFDQQVEGAAQQAEAYYNYIVTNQDVDDPWSTWYTNAMASCRDLISQSEAKGYHQYAGVGQILLAYSLQQLTDAWGDIPYSTAFKGVGNTNPTFDPSSAIYADIYALTDSGINNLNNSDAGAVLLNSAGEDRIYQGDVSKWIKFAHAIRARLDIHQSKNNTAMATNALTEVGESFTSNADNAVFPFGSSETTANPWYQFNEERTGYTFYPTSTLASIMANQADPRYTVYFDSTYSDFWQVGLGNYVTAGNNAYYGMPASPGEFITYDELLFISAEANLRLGQVGAAQTNFTDAIRADFSKLGIDAPTTDAYIAAHGTLPGNVDDAIDTVAKEEYIALFLNPEAWTVWRRTGSPDLQPITGSQGIPRRLPYPQTEYSYNKANTPSATLWSPRIFWDTP